jgi:hypothetical protein
MLLVCRGRRRFVIGDAFSDSCSTHLVAPKIISATESTWQQDHPDSQAQAPRIVAYCT